jgi:hypothetical protein
MWVVQKETPSRPAVRFWPQATASCYDALDRHKSQGRGRRYRIGRRQTLPADEGNDY